MTEAENPIVNDVGCCNAQECMVISFVSPHIVDNCYLWINWLSPQEIKDMFDQMSSFLIGCNGKNFENLLSVQN
jgi:hypothetical protein